MKIALIQDYFSEVCDYNLQRMRYWISRAAANDANLVIFPECALSGYLGFGRDTLADALIEEFIAGIDAIRQLAETYSIAIVIGTYTRRCGRWYNTLLFIDADGRQLASYDKLQLVDKDCYHVAPGAAPPPVFTWRGLKVSLSICHDIRYPEVLRSAAIDGSQVHIHPFFGARNPSDIDAQRVYDAHLCTRAVENGFYILATNAAINEQMVRSQAVSPTGTILAKAESWGPELLLLELPDQHDGEGWRQRRRDDLFPRATRAESRSYFERAWWQSESMIIDHSLRGLNISPPVD